uniref:Podocalyxin like 2 n=1 Tax=Lepisosteus oculatus TaxID=7918 RepID=W5N7Y4_LEPOC|nr:PREDICTED: podocalyxin-like protein 2 [Lepisosteus oculatus]
MHGSHLVFIFIAGSSLLLGSCEEVSKRPGLSTSLSRPPMTESLDSAEQADLSALEPDASNIPGFLTGSQESGFSSEENEDPRESQPQYFWDEGEGGEMNNTSLDPDSQEGYSPSSFQNVPLQTPSDLNSSFAPMEPAEPIEPQLSGPSAQELWDLQGESSSSQSELHYSLSTDPGSLFETTQTEANSITEVFDPWNHDPHITVSVPYEATHRAHMDPGALSPSAATQADLGTSSESPPADYSAVVGDDFLEEVSMVTAVHKEAERKTSETRLSGTVSRHAVPSTSFTLIPWQGARTVTESTEPHFMQEETTVSFAGNEHEETALSQESVQVICTDWSDLTGKGYVILNMSENVDCDTFRVESGDRLLEMLESAFSRKMNSPQGSWFISLTKPNRQDKQLLMTLASEQGVIPTKEVLSMLGEIRRSLYEIGIQNYTSVTSCQSQPSQTRSDYGKLFVVLVIIGSVCVVIIVSGLIYICWQRRLPKLKNMSHGEELHFVENGCHDNPTLDVASDSQSEMQEKKPSVNGVAVDGGGSWHVLVNKSAKEDAENLEEDTHL